MVPIFQPDKRKAVPIEEIGIPVNIEGELEDYVIVSIPVTESRATAKTVRDQLSAALKRRVMVVTHNMQFLVTKRLNPKDAARVIKKMEDALYEQPTDKNPSANESESPTTQEAGVGGSDGVEGDGGGPRSSGNGDSGIGTSPREETPVAGPSGVVNPEGEQEGTPESSGGNG